MRRPILLVAMSFWISNNFAQDSGMIHKIFDKALINIHTYTNPFYSLFIHLIDKTGFK